MLLDFDLLMKLIKTDNEIIKAVCLSFLSVVGNGMYQICYGCFVHLSSLQ